MKRRLRTIANARRRFLRDSGKPKPSPRWFGPSILTVMFAGVIVIVLNYLGLMPGTHGTATNLWLFVGLGMIAAGFLAATQWR